MADGTARADAPAESLSRRDYGAVVVVGGGCYGSYYVRQLRRAVAREALGVERLIVVDRDEGCLAGRLAGEAGALPVDLHVAEWDAFFDDWLPRATSADAIVPSPLMPHLFLHWMARRALARAPGRRVELLVPAEVPDVPWQKAGDRARYVSFAEWMCPVNCIEPATCPHTRGPRSWSLPVALRRAPDRARDAQPRDWDAAALLHCTHRAYGVGMIDARDVLAADALVERAGEQAAARVLVGTVSHCHGALGILALG